jgi:hypothetical protein
MKTLLTSLFILMLSATIVAQAPVKLQLNLEKGKIYSIKNSTKQTMQQSVSGQSFNMNILANRVVSIRLLNQEKEAVELEIRLDSTITIVKSAVFNKESNSAKSGKDAVDRLMNKMSLYPLRVRFSNSGSYLSISNLDEYKSNVMQVIDSLPASKQDEGRKLAETLLKESALRSQVEPFFAHLTGKALAVGDRWESNYITNSNDMSILFFNTYTLKGVEADNALVSGSTEMESMASTNPAVRFDQPIKGTATFEGKVDLKSGLMRTVSEKSTMQGVLVANNGGADMKVELKVDAQTELSLKY